MKALTTFGVFSLGTYDRTDAKPTQFGVYGLAYSPHMSLTRPSVEIFSSFHMCSAEGWSQREFTAKSAPDRTKAERKLFAMVDINLGSVQS
eukprot:5385757-Prymnesium_polylepis.1